MTGRSSSSNCPQLPFALNQNCAADQLDLHRIRTLELEPEPELGGGGEKKYLSAKSKIQLLLLLVLFRHWAVHMGGDKCEYLFDFLFENLDSTFECQNM